MGAPVPLGQTVPAVPRGIAACGTCAPVRFCTWCRAAKLRLCRCAARPSRTRAGWLMGTLARLPSCAGFNVHYGTRARVPWCRAACWHPVLVVPYGPGVHVHGRSRLRVQPSRGAHVPRGATAPMLRGRWTRVHSCSPAHVCLIPGRLSWSAERLPDQRRGGLHQDPGAAGPWGIARHGCTCACVSCGAANGRRGPGRGGCVAWLICTRAVLFQCNRAVLRWCTLSAWLRGECAWMLNGTLALLSACTSAVWPVGACARVPSRRTTR